MVIAIAKASTARVTVDIDPPVSDPAFQVGIDVSANDGTHQAATGLTFFIPMGARTSAFNRTIFDGIKTWVDSQNGWNIDPKHIYFQPFVNGS